MTSMAGLRPLAMPPSKLPGGFETDDENSPTKTDYDDAHSYYDPSRRPSHVHAAINSDNHIPPDGPSSDNLPGHDEPSSMLDEGHVRRALADVESSFLPANSTSPSTQHPAPTPSDSTHRVTSASTVLLAPVNGSTTADFPHALDLASLESLSSSPTAAAAARSISRAVSMATIGEPELGYETAEEGIQLTAASPELGSGQSTPTRSHQHQATDTTPTTSTSHAPSDTLDSSATHLAPITSPRRRPKDLDRRRISQQSSYSSHSTTISADGTSDLTLGAEYAIQTGGGVPLLQNSAQRNEPVLNRTTSLGSVASSLSRFSHEDRQVTPQASLDVLTEEKLASQSHLQSHLGRDAEPQTPAGEQTDLQVPTDTVLNQHVQALNVPGTVARKFKTDEAESTLNGGPTPAEPRVKNLTLKEQSGLIDKLQKENWKLKLKLYYMDQMLAERSDESVRAMISENVELKSNKFGTAKEIRTLKRTVKELEAKLKERDERLAAQTAESRRTQRSQSYKSEPSADVSLLRARLESLQLETNHLRDQTASLDAEKRRLADMVQQSGQRSTLGSDGEVRDEIAMWKDLLEAETARKTQAEAESRRLQAELWRLKEDGISAVGSPEPLRRPSIAPLSSDGRPGSQDTMVDQLRHENAELRRDLGAQTSMLTSRNREKERLYQEIEDLKMDRSVSRVQGRGTSRASSRSRVTQIGDAEREHLESTNTELRDQMSGLRLENQELATQLDRILDELERCTNSQEDLERLQHEYDELHSQTNAEILAMQGERDEALQAQEESDLNFQDLRSEAQGRINALEEELDHNAESARQLERELAAHQKEADALRNEVRMTSDGLSKVESDAQARLRRIQEMEMEHEEISKELETLENALIAANGKSEKLSIELESRQSECAFLREEQDGCMLKIGDLEAALRTAQASLTAERDKARDLDTRLAEERHQREVIGSQEKQEVQKLMNDMNREAGDAREDARRLREARDTSEAELQSWKQRLTELERGLQEILGESGHSSTSFLLSVARLQKDLDHTTTELANTRQGLSEKNRVLQKRDALLESHGLETRKLSDLLEKERAGRRADRVQHEHWQQSHQLSSRSVSQKDGRIADLEASRHSDRRRLSQLEHQFKEQLTERNSLLLGMWNRLSALCGSDWQHHNNLVSGHFPTLEVVGSKLPQFSKSLLLAVKTIETLVGTFPSQIRAVERDLTKDYQQLEHNLDLRIKRLDRLESNIQVSRVSGVANATPEIAKLRGENRLLKADLAVLQKQEQVRVARQQATSPEGEAAGSPTSNIAAGPGSKARAAAAMLRHHSATAVEMLQRDPEAAAMASMPTLANSQPIEPNQQRWIHRLRELERRLKAEREARLLDRSGARKRLEEGRMENEELKQELAREKERARMYQGPAETSI